MAAQATIDESVAPGLHVAVIEDHPLYRLALESALASDDLDVDLSVATIEEFLARSQDRPDVVIADLHLPGIHGVDGVRQLVTEGHTVLVLTASTNSEDVVRTIGEGARGYLCKDAQATEICTAVRAVGSGRGYVSPTLAGHLLQASRQAAAELPELSDREREVLSHLARGKTDHAIADDLCISVSTVRSHLDRIRDKTGKRRRAELTRFAIENSILAG